MSNPLRKIAPDEFARRLKRTTQEADKRFAFFLGAGCSVSSGIPDAGALVREEWLPLLRDLRAPHRDDLNAWAKDEFPGWDPESAAVFYGPVLTKLFLKPEERQREIERLCDGRFPGFGYATLASLVAFAGGLFNVVLTTNFDDLVADALYLFTSARPLVIQHESLASYIRPTRTRPLVVKLHGDQRLSPQNTTEETQVLKAQIEKQVRTLLNDRGLIFMGYGGNDAGIAAMLEALPEEALPLGVFWTGRREPHGLMRAWLEQRDAVWIEKGSFDELMLLIRDVFNLPHPERRRFDEVFEKYKLTYAELSGRIVALPDTAPDASALKEAVRRTDESFPDSWAVIAAALRVQQTDPDRAESIYRAGSIQFAGVATLLAYYANFLQTIRKDYDAAEAQYRRALSTEPGDVVSLGAYAFFLETIRNDYEGAEVQYRLALEANPSYANTLFNYANFLRGVRKDYDGAESYYRRALTADPRHSFGLSSYAHFLAIVRNDHTGADALYRRSLEAAPFDWLVRGNYAGFLLAHGQREEGRRLLRAVLQQPELVKRPDMAAECWFYEFAHGPAEMRPEALRELRRLLERGVRSLGWDLTDNFKRAQLVLHPHAAWVAKLASVISEGADFATLQGWAEWEKAKSA